MFSIHLSNRQRFKAIYNNEQRNLQEVTELLSLLTSGRVFAITQFNHSPTDDIPTTTNSELIQVNRRASHFAGEISQSYLKRKQQRILGAA
jgi:hypothetical protein